MSVSNKTEVEKAALMRQIAYAPFSLGILLVPVIQVPQLIVRIIFESYSACGRPFCVFLRDPLLCNALHAQLLAFPQFADHTAEAFTVRNHRPAN